MTLVTRQEQKQTAPNFGVQPRCTALPGGTLETDTWPSGPSPEINWTVRRRRCWSRCLLCLLQRACRSCSCCCGADLRDLSLHPQHGLLRLHIPGDYHKQFRQVSECHMIPDARFRSSAAWTAAPGEETVADLSLRDGLVTSRKPPSQNSDGNFIHNFRGFLEEAGFAP